MAEAQRGRCDGVISSFSHTSPGPQLASRFQPISTHLGLSQMEMLEERDGESEGRREYGGRERRREQTKERGERLTGGEMGDERMRNRERFVDKGQESEGRQ